MKKIFLHIGTDKTGSTAIQKFLFSNEKSINALGISLPESDFQHHEYIYSAVCNNELSVLNAVTESIKQSEFLIHVISFEGFYHLEGEGLEIFLRFFCEFDLKIVLYLRNRPDIVRSGLAQRLKMNQPERDMDFFLRYMTDDNLDKILYSTSLDYKSIVDRWDQALRNIGLCDAISLGLYEEISLFEGDLILDFMNRLGVYEGETAIDFINNLHVKNYKNINLSLSPAAQYMMVLAVMFGLSGKYLNKFRSLIIDIDENDDRKKSLIKDKSIKKMQKYFSRNDKEVANKYFGRRTLFKGGEKFSECQDFSAVFFDFLYRCLREREVFEFLLNNKSGYPALDPYVNSIRDVACGMENDNFNKAYDLMKLASVIRPDGPFIKRKIDEYEGILKSNEMDG